MDIDIDEIDIDFDLIKEVDFEEEDNVFNLDKGFYIDDKSVHILNLLSRDSNINKFQKYWDKKISNVLTVFDGNSNAGKVSYNTNVYPYVDFKQKITEQDPDEIVKMMYKYNDDNVEVEPLLIYLVNRKNIVGKYTYSSYTEHKQYSALAPYVIEDNTFSVPIDTDCFTSHKNRHRMLSSVENVNEGDHHKLLGYYNCINVYDGKYINFNFDDYINHIESLAKKDIVFLYFHSLSKLIIHGTVSKINKYEIEIKIDDNRIEVFYKNDYYKNEFFIYTEQYKNKLFKSDFLKYNILFTFTQQNMTQLLTQFVCVSANDVILLQDNKNLLTLDQLQIKYPNILDNIKSNESINNLFLSGISKAKKIETRKTHKIATQKQSLSDIEVAESILLWIKSIKQDSFTNIELEHEKPDLTIFKDTLTFLSVDEMINYRIKKFDSKARAYLVLYKNYYKIKNKIFPLTYTCYRLKQVMLEKYPIWNIDIKTDVPKASIRMVDITFSKKEIEKHLIAYIKRKKQIRFFLERTPFKYNTFKSYNNFQGVDDFNSETVAEFGVQLDKMIEDEIENSVIPKQSSNAFEQLIIHQLAAIANLELTNTQISYISKRVQFNEKLPTLEKVKKLCSCFSFFIIFIFISLPNKILKSNVEDMISYPLIPDKTKTSLIKHMIIVIDQNASKIEYFNKINVQRLNSDIIVDIINKILKSSPFLEVLLQASYQKLMGQNKTKENVLNKYRIWDNFKPQKHLENRQGLIIDKELTQHIKNNLFIIKNKISNNNNSIIVNEVIPQTNTHIVKLEGKKESKENYLVTLLEGNELLKHDQYLSNLIVEDIDIENQLDILSKYIDEIVEKDNELEQFKDFVVKNINNKKTVLIFNECIVYNIKDILGKIRYGFEITSTNEKNRITHDEFIQHSKYYINPVGITEIDNILRNMLNFNILQYTHYTKYLLLYIVLKVVSILNNNEIRKYLFNLIYKKVKLNTMSREDVLSHFQKQREIKKQNIMQMYKGMDDDMRRLNKNMVDLGLISKEDLMLQNAISQEDIEMRLNNENDEYDVNEEE